MADDDDDDDSEFDDNDGDDVLDDGKTMTASHDPSKLIDLELIKLLKFCEELRVKHKDSDEYQDEIMMKSLTIGKKTKDKTLILDMDETLIASKFGGKEPKNFVCNFEYEFSGNKIKVRLRPYIHDVLEKLS